jgi:hypothetical protein
MARSALFRTGGRNALHEVALESEEQDQDWYRIEQ